MCGRLRTKYAGCGCIIATNTARCNTEEYLGNSCPRYRSIVLRFPGSCREHLEDVNVVDEASDENLATGDDGGSDWKHRNGYHDGPVGDKEKC